MKIRIVAFASAADALGAGELDVELPAGSRVVDLKQLLEARSPKLARHWPRLAVAVDGELAGGETLLAEGVEVALLPPVSGGVGDGTDEVPGSLRAALTEGPLDVAAVTAAVAASARGAVLVFLGTVRDHHAGRRVEKLTYTGYRPMAERRLAAIVDDLEAASGNLRAAIVHRLGEVPAGQPSVVIAVASPHRAEAYEASRRALERLKAEVPIWKREHYAGGEAVWREEEPLVAPQRQPSTNRG